MMAEKKKAKFSATARSMQWLRQQGWVCDKTEQTVRWPNHAVPGTFKTIKRDLFGLCDILCVKRGEILFVQTTTVSNQADRVNKLLALANTFSILEAGGKIHVHGWGKKGPRGKAKFWRLTVTEITLGESGSLKTGLVSGTEVDNEETGQSAMFEESEPF